MAEALQKQVDKLKRKILSLEDEITENKFQSDNEIYQLQDEIENLRDFVNSLRVGLDLCREAIVAINNGKILKFRREQKENPAASSEPGCQGINEKTSEEEV